MQGKCAAYTRLAATVEDCIRGEKKGRNRDKGDCVQERGRRRYVISDLKRDFVEALGGVPRAEKGG